MEDSQLTPFHAYANDFQDQHETLNASYTFSLDALPVRFGSYRIFENAVDSGSGSVGSKDSQRSQLNAAMADLAEIIWKEGGFRFRHTATTHKTLTFSYNCSQDAKFVDKYESKVAPEKRRDASRMLRFPCQSKLSMRPCFENRTLSLSIRHEWHEPYQSIRLSPEALALITSMVSTKTPAEIYREIQDFPEAENVTRHQVYYLWQRANAGLWQRDADPMKSATILLSEDDRYRDAYDCIPWMNVRALIFYSLEVIRKLAGSITQLVMDATYGTNNGGMDLFCVLAEVDGSGIPLGYCLVEVTGPPRENSTCKNPRRAEPGATGYVLCRFLERLKSWGFEPTCFAIDKDQSEISAVESVWPHAKIQLCYWHVKRAVSLKMNDPKATKTQEKYRPGQAKKLIPDLEICWGSKRDRRPKPHSFGGCQCPSRSESVTGGGRLETRSKQEQNTVLEIMARHFHLHPLIPDDNGTFKSSEMIHRESATEMYRWCKARGYYRLWAYMWTNWYSEEHWKRWARSGDPSAISTVKTTMIAESHWRTLKHAYLHRFNRPRADLMVWILATRVLPDALRRLTAILNRDSRIYKARWREGFKKQWKKDSSKLVDSEKLTQYHTDPVRWVCGCRAFLMSRFLLCKHIVYCFESPNPEMFRTIQRRTTPPFWQDERLVLRPEFAPPPGTDIRDQIEAQVYLQGQGEESESEDEPSSEDDDDQKPLATRFSEFKEMIQEALALADDQFEKGSEKFVEKFMLSGEPYRVLLEEVKSRQRKRNGLKTWGRYRHPATMYLK